MGMLKQIPAEITYILLHGLHSTDIASLAEAVVFDRSLYNNVFLPCRSCLEPIVEVARRRAYFERLFGQADDFTDIHALGSSDLLCVNNSGAVRQETHRTNFRRMRHEHTTAFLRFDDTLHWLPPFKGTTYGENDYFAELTDSESKRLQTAAVQLNLSLPFSFLKLVSNARMMQRIPYRFWLPDLACINSASQYISNGRGGYMIDFCHKSDRETGSTLWSLWLEPAGSHCVLRRHIAPRSTDIPRKPTAQLAGTSFELWLANAFYTCWTEPDVVYPLTTQCMSDEAINDCVSRYLQYNGIS